VNVSVKGAELFYSTRGQGPACLVLSAIGTGPYERLTPPQLSDRLRLVYVDLRGGGRSTGEPTDLSFDLLADDLEAIRVDLGVERVAGLRHSILGTLAMEYARLCPESVSHVIAAGTPPSGDLARLSMKATLFFEEDAAEERKLLLRKNLDRLPSDASFSQTLLAQTPKRFFDARSDASPLAVERESNPRLLGHILRTLAPGWDVTVGSRTLRVPILIAHGRYDYTVPYVLWDGIVAKLPNARLQIFEQSGHHPFFEEPDRFVAALTEWMASQR